MNQHITVQPLVYNGEIVASRDEMVSLTDMWRASGADEAKRPANWARKEGSEFIAFIADAQNVPVGHIIKGARGRSGSTMANWQIGLAYGKYLSPALHAWCNTVVRERMEGKSVSVAHLTPDVLELIRSSQGISRMLAHKVVGLEKDLAALMEVVRPATPVRFRFGKTAGEIWKRYGLPKLKNAPTWLGNRLVEMGCMAERYDRGGDAVRLFDPDRAELVMKNGLLHRTKQYVSERQGQGKLRLVGEAV